MWFALLRFLLTLVKQFYKLSNIFAFQISIVGDFSEEDIESCILDYLGTVNTAKTSEAVLTSTPFTYRQSPSDLQFQQVIILMFESGFISAAYLGNLFLFSDDFSLLKAN